MYVVPGALQNATALDACDAPACCSPAYYSQL